LCCRGYQAADCALNDIPKGSAGLPNDRWVRLTTQLGPQRCHLSFRPLLLTFIKTQFIPGA
jgi:hypothetical protein